MGLWKSLYGVVRVKISAASPAQLITRINNAEIDLIDIMVIDDLTIEASVLRKDISGLKKITEKYGESIKIIHKAGLFWIGKRIIHRKLLVIVTILFLLLTFYLPTRILFVQVEGNTHIPSNYIIEVAESSGITFGASRRHVRSENVKNLLLEKIPELQWTGINTYGCVAVISVKERTHSDKYSTTGTISNIIALQDGVIEQCTVLQGNALCKVGQSVKKGQVLVSGYIDCERFIKGVRAEAEIYARTMRKIKAVTPLEKSIREGVTERKTNYLLKFGKKLIKISQDSGISTSCCVKMYETRYLTLPGGFKLPVALVIERYQDYTCKTDISCDTASYEWLNDFSGRYLQNHMIAGKIVSSNSEVKSLDDCLVLEGRYICSEMIGQNKYEEIIQYNGEAD